MSSTRFFAVVMAMGAGLRVAALLLPGTHDVAVWKIWSYAAATDGIGRIYGVGGRPPEHRAVSLHGATATVDYPPLAVAELGLVGRVYRWQHSGAYPDDWRLIVAVKIPILLADAGILMLLYRVASRRLGPERARWCAAVYWLNPAVLLDGVMLGYLDTLFVLPALASLAAAAAGPTVIAGALAAAAVLTKPQAIVIAPALALAVAWPGDADGAARRIVRAACGSAIAALLVLAPVALAGAMPNLVNALSRLGYHDMLSGNATNLWWIVGYALRAYYSAHDMGAWAAITAPTRILAISRVVELGYPSPRAVGTALTLLAAAWACWTIAKAPRARDLWIVAALAAFVAHAFATLSAQVHENHLFAAVPFLALAAAGRPAFAPVLAAVSATLALNLNLFYGISEDLGYALPRTLTPVDLSVLLAVANCALLVWHARVFSRECSTAAGSRPAPVPASIPAPAGRSRW